MHTKRTICNKERIYFGVQIDFNTYTYVVACTSGAIIILLKPNDILREYRSEYYSIIVISYVIDNQRQEHVFLVCL
jgi:hypothetical protein